MGTIHFFERVISLLLVAHHNGVERPAGEQHHEKIDGTGYPEGKKGEEISEYAKIVAIAEVYEAITHPRPYRREKIIPYEGVKVIVQNGKNSFDPELVKVFLNILLKFILVFWNF